MTKKNPNNLRIAVFGDITGVAGRATAEEAFKIAREEWGADLIIANGENASHGFGITPRHVIEQQKPQGKQTSPHNQENDSNSVKLVLSGSVLSLKQSTERNNNGKRVG